MNDKRDVECQIKKQMYNNNDDNDIGNFVDSVYQNILGRKSDPAGRNTYINLIKTGEICMRDLPMILKNSHEYLDKIKKERKEQGIGPNNKQYLFGDYHTPNDIPNNNGLSFPINYGELYKPFDKELIKEIGISWFGAQKIYHELGNSPGIYPDTALLFVKIIKNFSINKVLEFGSGMSTLFISKVCELKNVKFTSYEEDNNYKKTNIGLLKIYNIKDSENIIKSITNTNGASEEDLKLFKKNADNIDLNVDLIFLDSYGYSRDTLLVDSRIYDIPFVIYDDAENTHHLIKHIRNLKDHNFYIYDRVGRLDRQQFISYPSKHNFVDFITKNIPCIGTW